MQGLGWAVMWTATVFAQPASGQDPELPGDPPGETVQESPRAVPIFATHTWYDAVPVDAGTRVFMDLVGVGPRGLAVDGGGGVWRTVDGGNRWRMVLPALAQVSGPGDQSPGSLGSLRGDGTLDYRTLDLARDYEEQEEDDWEFDRAYEDVDTYGSGELDEVEEEATTAASEEGLADANTLEADLSQEVILEGLLRDARTTGLQEGSMRLGGVAWIHPDLPDLALVGRADGIWRSMDAGATWRRVDPIRSTTIFLAGPGELLLAGTADGLKYSVDQGRAWLDKEDPMDGQRVRDLAYSGDGTWWCATEQGLFTSQDGENWEEAAAKGLRGTDVRALSPEPGSTSSLLVADNDTLYRTDDGGASVIPLGRQPLLDTTSLLTVEGAGHLLASGSDGVWETTDGGLVWHPVASGLTEPQVFDLAVLDGQVFAATLNGLLRLAERGEVTATPAAPDPTQLNLARSIPLSLNHLVVASTHRIGLNPEFFLANGVRRDRWIPWLEFYGRYDLGNHISTQFSNPPTAAFETRDFTVLVNMGWGKAATNYSDFLVVDGGLVVDTSSRSGSLPGMLASSTREMTAYRHALVDLITELFLAHQQLLDHWAAIPTDDLRAQVLHILQIQEVAARLDGYTDGAFSRGTVTPENP